MRIKEIYIYGYGKMENERFTNMTELHVFFGKNEAGKSTIMSFIHSLLFGFPTKVQNELRYEPKMHAKYGGLLIVATKQYGEIRIERVKGKATGDVSVTFENGEVAGEEILNKILHSMDKTYYQSIFSFDLQGLQGLHTMGEGDIGKYLLSAGLVGNDKILDAEGRLQKELDLRFKPSGQKPLLNSQMKQLKVHQQNMKNSGDDQLNYNELQSELKGIGEELEELKKQSQVNEEQLFYTGEYLRIKPLAEEQAVIQARLDQLGDQVFPTDGLKRLEQLNTLLLQHEAKQVSIQQQYQELMTDKEKMVLSPFLQDNKENIDTAIESSTLLEQLELDKHKAEKALELVSKEIDNLKDDLSFKGHVEAILQLDFSTFMKEKIRTLAHKKRVLSNEKEQLDERDKRVKGRLEQSEMRLEELKCRRLPKEQRLQLEIAKDQGQNNQYHKVKKEMLDEQIADLERIFKVQEKKERDQLSKKRGIFAFISLILLGLSFYSIFTKQTILTVFFVVALFAIWIGLFFFKEKHTLTDYKQRISEAKEKRVSFEKDESQTRSIEFESDAALRLLEQDRELERLIANEAFKKEEREQAFEDVIHDFETWEASWNTVQAEAMNIVKVWGLPDEAIQHDLEEVFGLLEKLKVKVEEKNVVRKNNEHIHTEIQNRKKTLFYYTGELEEFPGTWQEALTVLKRALNDLFEKQIQLKQHVEEETKTMVALEKHKAEKNYVIQQMQELYDKANAEDEDDFREKGLRAEERLQLLSQLKLVVVQLGQSRIQGEQLTEYMGMEISRYTLENLEAIRNEIISRQSMLLEKQSDLKHRIRQLEEGGLYDDRMHQFHEARRVFNEEAKDWAKYAVARSLLNQTIDTFKKERLPSVISKAEEYLFYLTDGQYSRIFLNHEADGFSVQRSDHLIFDVNEVSRGTAEQIYVALRLALADYTFKEDPFPLIIDDSFVNFDSKRTGNTLALLAKISEQRQIIFFTCHEHLLNHFSKGSLTYLSNPMGASL
ncbi:AAA family ATPase [Peribacillus loiseleuriae]|uniref:ATP-binding protein n=1 Tax=Peribacillus loiseleuriae TaxID=1679170 RepID=UPI003D08CB91